MVSDIILGTLIAGGFFLAGIIATLVGQIISTNLTHNKKIKFLKEENFFKKKLDYYEQISKKLEEDLIKYNNPKIFSKTKKSSGRKIEKELDKYETDKKEITSSKISFFQDKKLAEEYLEYLQIKKEFRAYLKENKKNELNKKLKNMFNLTSNLQNRIIDILKKKNRRF